MANPIFTQKTTLDLKIMDKFLQLDQDGKVQAEYIWIGGTGSDIRSKTKTLSSKPTNVSQL